MASKNNSTIYVGNLPADLRKSELCKLFDKYGQIVDMQFQRGRQYAFLEFQSRRDALEAIEGRNNLKYDGLTLKVEMSRGLWGPSPSRPQHTNHRVLVKNIPFTTTWQELKDHMRMAGYVCFSDVKHGEKSTVGIVEYLDEATVNYAIEKLNYSRLKNSFEERRILVVKDGERSTAPEHKSTDKQSNSRNSENSPSPSRKHSRSATSSPTAAAKRRRI